MVIQWGWVGEERDVLREPFHTKPSVRFAATHGTGED